MIEDQKNIKGGEVAPDVTGATVEVHLQQPQLSTRALFQGQAIRHDFQVPFSKGRRDAATLRIS